MDDEYLLSDYVKEVLDFQRSSASYEARVGSPDELSSVIGKISIAFQRLKDVLSTYIILMLDVEVSKGKIVIAELSFNNKINIFSSLFQQLKNERKFNYGKFNKDDFFKELRKSILRCQDFRNQVLHSSFLQNFKTEFKILKHKISAKSKQGLKENIEVIEIPYLFDIADYITHISMEIEQFFIGFSYENEKNRNKFNRNELSDIFEFRV